MDADLVCGRLYTGAVKIIYQFQNLNNKGILDSLHIANFYCAIRESNINYFVSSANYCAKALLVLSSTAFLVHDNAITFRRVPHLIS